MKFLLACFSIYTILSSTSFQRNKKKEEKKSDGLSRLIWSYPEMVLGPFQAACFGPAD